MAFAPVTATPAAGERRKRILAWIDIDNPPQVQFLYRFREAFEELGADVVVTARDQGITLQLLEQQGAEFDVVGTGFGRRKWQKIYGLLRRSAALAWFLRRHGRPDVLVCAGRVSALTARLLRTPAFILDDYEHMDLSLYGFTRAHVAFPDVVDGSAFARQGIPPGRHLPYRGLKEDITFAGLDLEAVEPHGFPGVRDDLVKVLFRPPAEESHYYREDSGRLTLDLLEYLAAQERAVVVLAPRYLWQTRYLERFDWLNEPIVLREGVPFLSLLKGCDLVVSSGGTMVREAAYIGLPAYSIFKGERGGVDLYLESIGRLRFLSSATDFEALRLDKAPPLRMLSTNPDLLRELTETMLERIGAPAHAAAPNEARALAG